MDKLTKAQLGIQGMDDIAAGESFVHQISPLCKLLVTVTYIFVVTSFDKYDISGLTAMVLYPVFTFQAAQIPLYLCFYRLRIILPFVCAVGLANPFLDHVPVAQFGAIVVTGGFISMFTLMMKGCLALMASFLLIATTPVDSLCAALRRIHMPAILVTLFLLTYRYIGVMIDEASAMTQAYCLRAPKQRGIHISAWGSFLGQLLLRSIDRAQELYSSMILRGFRGNFFYSDIPTRYVGGILFTVISICFFVCARLINITQFIGSLFVR